MSSCVCRIIFLAILTSISKGSQVYPVSYTYDNRNVTRSQHENCNWLHDSFVYRCCTHPNVLTDSVIDMSDRGSYRSPTNRDVQFLFTFSPPVLLTHITLYYDNDDTYGLPNVTFLAAADDYEIWNETQGTIIANVSAIPPGQGQPGLQNITTVIIHNVNVTTKPLKLLMIIPDNGYKISLRQIEFFGNQLVIDLLPMSTTTTVSESGINQTTVSVLVSPNMKSTSVTTMSSNLSSLVTQSHSINPSTISTSSVTSSSRLVVSRLRTNDGTNSSLLGAGVSVTVFALLLCFTGIPLISILVIRHSKGRCRQRSKKSIAKPAQPQGSQFHSSTSEKIELCENSNSEYACIGVSYKSTAMTSSADVDVSNPGESKVPQHDAMPDMSHNSEEINSYSYSTIPNEFTQHNITTSKPSPVRPLPAVPSSLHSHNHEEDALTCTTAPKKEVKHKSKQAAHEVPIQVDEDAPPVPPQTVDCLYAAVMKKNKRKPPALGPAT